MTSAPRVMLQSGHGISMSDGDCGRTGETIPDGDHRKKISPIGIRDVDLRLLISNARIIAQDLSLADRTGLLV